MKDCDLDILASMKASTRKLFELVSSSAHEIIRLRMECLSGLVLFYDEVAMQNLETAAKLSSSSETLQELLGAVREAKKTRWSILAEAKHLFSEFTKNLDNVLTCRGAPFVELDLDRLSLGVLYEGYVVRIDETALQTAQIFRASRSVYGDRAFKKPEGVVALSRSAHNLSSAVSRLIEQFSEWCNQLPDTRGKELSPEAIHIIRRLQKESETLLISTNWALS